MISQKIFSLSKKLKVGTVSQYNSKDESIRFQLYLLNIILAKIAVFDCNHTVPCVGYGLSELRQKLKPEYGNLSGSEIGTLKKKGIPPTLLFSHNERGANN